MPSRAAIAVVLLLASCSRPQASLPRPSGQGGDPGGSGGAGGAAAGGEAGEGGGSPGGAGGAAGQLACPDGIPAPDELRQATIHRLVGARSDRLSLVSGAGERVCVLGVVTDGVDAGDGEALASDGVDDALVAAYDGDAFAWKRVFASPGQDRIDAATLAPGGDLILSVTTAWDRKEASPRLVRLAQADGAPLWDVPAGGFRSLASGGDALFTGTTCGTDGVGLVCVEKRDLATGAVLWQRRFGGDYLNDLGRVLAAPGGDVIVWGVAGQEETLVDFGDGDPVGPSTSFAFILRLDGADGSLRWKLPLLPRRGTFGNSSLAAVGALPGGDLVALGAFGPELDVGREVLTAEPAEYPGVLLRVDGATGAVRWAVATGYPEPLYAAQIVGDDARVLIAGSSQGATAFAGVPYEARDPVTLVLAEVSPVDGTVRSVRPILGASLGITTNALAARCDGALHLGLDVEGAVNAGPLSFPGDRFFTDGMWLQELRSR